GDFVVHLEHGIARFLGLQKFGSARPEPLPSEVEGGAPGNAITDGPAVRPYQQEAQEVLVLEFADEAKFYVPLEQAYLVSRYVGVVNKSQCSRRLRFSLNNISRCFGGACSTIRCGSKCSAVSVHNPNRRKYCSYCAKAALIWLLARIGLSLAMSFSKISASS